MQIVIVIFWLIVGLGPWIYHLVYCFTKHEYILLIAGGLIPPIGWIHGLGALFNWW